MTNSPCGESICDWFSWYGNPELVIVDTSSNWDIRHLLTDPSNYKKGLSNMEKSGMLKKYKSVGNAVLYKVVEKPQGTL